MPTIANVWKQTLATLELELDPAIVSTWFKKTHLYETTEDKIIIACSDTYSKSVIEHRYGEKIKKIIAELAGKRLALQFIVKPTAVKEPIHGPLFDEIPGNPEHNQNESGPATLLRSSVGALPERRNLNQQYTLDNFIVGASNRIVHAAATSVIEQPGVLYNPLFIYGPTGVGKTHMLHAIGNEIKARNPDFRFVYASTEQFVNDMIDHIRQHKDMQLFRGKYRNAHVLLVDDIQFLAGKEASQEEFYHTFNELYNIGSQIVIASDREPSQINGLADRLVSRFKGGLITMINPPDFETRLAILQHKASELDLSLTESIANYLAEKGMQSVREIQGILLQIKSAVLTRNQPLTLHLVQSLFEGVNEPKAKRITTELVLDLVTRYFNTSIKDLCGKRRTKAIVIPRQMAMFLLRNEIGMNYSDIGQILGGRDHSTVLHGCDRIKNDIEINNHLVLRSHLSNLRQELYG